MGQNFSRLPRSRLLTGEISVDGKIVVPYANTTFPHSGKTFCLHFTKSCHSGKLYPVSGITFLHMNRTKLFDSSKCFLANRDNVCPHEQALSAYYISFYIWHLVQCVNLWLHVQEISDTKVVYWNLIMISAVIHSYPILTAFSVLW